MAVSNLVSKATGRCHPFRRPLRESSQWQESTKQSLRLSNHPVDACHSKPGRRQFLRAEVEQCRSERPLAGRDGVVAVPRSRIGWQVAVCHREVVRCWASIA